MNLRILFFGFLTCALLAWGIIATIVALRERNNYQTTNSLLRIAYSALDNCFSYCGGPGAWADGQKSKVNELVLSILQSQTKISCDNPSSGFSALSQCATSALSQTYSYWTIVDPANRAAGTSLILSAVNQCISSGQVSGCKIQN